MINKSLFDRGLLYLICIVVLSLAVYTVRGVLTKKEVAYIDITKLVQNYKLKKDLENVAGQNLYRIKAVIDSLKMVQKMAGPNDIQLNGQLASAEQAFKQYYAESNEKITREIWERLNPVIEQYGKEKQLELLIGATGAGSLLYADKKRDLTEDLTAYANKRYEKSN